MYLPVINCEDTRFVTQELLQPIQEEKLDNKLLFDVNENSTGTWYPLSLDELSPCAINAKVSCVCCILITNLGHMICPQTCRLLFLLD
jgi:hypothetical protein